MEKELAKQIITEYVFGEFDIKAIYQFVDNSITDDLDRKLYAESLLANALQKSVIALNLTEREEIINLTIRDFKVGETAYSVTMNRGCYTKPFVQKEIVASVGRTYVTTEINAWKYRYMNWDTVYLQEKSEYGKAKLLFKTMSDANDYIEKCDLALWLGTMSVSKAEKYSLDQLRKVKLILEC